MSINAVKAILEWLPYLLLAAFSGLFNVISSCRDLQEKTKRYIAFKPYKSWIFWLWLFFQILLPAVFFVGMTSLYKKPPIGFNFDTLKLIFDAIAYGVFFVTLLNSTDKAGILPINIKPTYDEINKIFYERIAASQIGVTSAFFTELENHLSRVNKQGIEKGILRLENYFFCDNSLSQETKNTYQAKLNDIKNERNRQKQAKAITSLMDVRRKDFPEILKAFNCTATWIKKYFPD